MENVFGLNNLCAGERFSLKRVGRGIGSGKGKTSGKGHKGAKARCGRVSTPYFEGGQMPIYRRLPKRGFVSHFDKKSVAVVGLKSIQVLIDSGHINANDEISIESLKALGLVRSNATKLRILGGENISIALNVKANYLSASAKETLEKVGSKIEVI